MSHEERVFDSSIRNKVEKRRTISRQKSEFVEKGSVVSARIASVSLNRGNAPNTISLNVRSIESAKSSDPARAETTVFRCLRNERLGTRLNGFTGRDRPGQIGQCANSKASGDRSRLEAEALSYREG